MIYTRFTLQQQEFPPPPAATALSARDHPKGQFAFVAAKLVPVTKSFMWHIPILK